MKALAAEMVRNFGTRLSPLGITVKELTGDMQLTKHEIQHTQVLGFCVGPFNFVLAYSFLYFIHQLSKVSLCKYGLPWAVHMPSVHCCSLLLSAFLLHSFLSP